MHPWRHRASSARSSLFPASLRDTCSLMPGKGQWLMSIIHRPSTDESFSQYPFPLHRRSKPSQAKPSQAKPSERCQSASEEKPGLAAGLGQAPSTHPRRPFLKSLNTGPSWCFLPCRASLARAWKACQMGRRKAAAFLPSLCKTSPTRDVIPRPSSASTTYNQALVERKHLPPMQQPLPSSFARSSARNVHRADSTTQDNVRKKDNPLA